MAVHNLVNHLQDSLNLLTWHGSHVGNKEPPSSKPTSTFSSLFSLIAILLNDPLLSESEETGAAIYCRGREGVLRFLQSKREMNYQAPVEPACSLARNF